MEEQEPGLYFFRYNITDTWTIIKINIKVFPQDDQTCYILNDSCIFKLESINGTLGSKITFPGGLT